VSNSSDNVDFTADSTANADDGAGAATTAEAGQGAGAKGTGTIDPAEGMIVQRVLFAPPADWIDPDLYFTVEGGAGAGAGTGGGVVPSRTGIELGPHVTVATDTYFGRFRASQWQRWTTIPEVTIRGRASGDVRIRAYTEDIGGHLRLEASHARASAADIATSPEVDVELTVPLDRFADGGAIHVVVDSADKGGAVSDLRYTVAADQVRRDIPTDIVICSFNRPVDCANTVATLADDLAALDRVRTIRVVDQGDQHPEDEADFQRARQILGERLDVVKQPNLGGAGGFSRGMRDATAAGDCQILLTDDDIRPEPETTLRLSALACCAAKPMLLGAQMLFLYNPTHLFRTGEVYDWKSLTVLENDDLYAKADVDVRENHQLRRLGVDYNAWWTCLVPSQVVEEIGLALPLFFQYDDIDFGYRAAKAGFPTDTVPGAAVWHADFYWKDVENAAQYFGLRNGLIATTMHGPVTAKDMVGTVSRRILSNIVSMRYGLAWTQMEAVKDMLRGPSVLDEASQGDFGRISAGRADYPETKLLPLSDMPAGLSPVRPPTREIASDDQTFAKRVAYTQLGKKRPGPVAVAFEDAFWWHISTFDEVWVTDASQSGVRRLVRDRDRELKLRSELLGLMRRLNSEWDSVRDQWRAAVPELTSADNWEKFFRG
jgi:galactofuranosylgalactofuranosylrhamnosyl-N-acetylglucosaminyl-diphospho-decaprenol beta-1,5/1,6-galactofuranosyltransferase